MTRFQEFLLLGVTFPLLACQHSVTPASAPLTDEDRAEKREVLHALAPCPAPSTSPAAPPPPISSAVPTEPPPGASGGPVEPGVYVELGVFEVPLASKPDAKQPLAAPRPLTDPAAELERLAQDDRARFLGAPQLMVRSEAPSQGIIAERTGPLLEAALRDVTARVKPAAGGAFVLEFELGIDLPHEGFGAPTRRAVKASASPRGDELVGFVASVPGLPGKSLHVLAVPYVIRGESDLRALFQCKMQRREQAVRNR